MRSFFPGTRTVTSCTVSVVSRVSLDEYRRRRLAADSTSLSTFIKRRSGSLASLSSLARTNAARPVGADRLRPLMRHSPPPYDRGESVKSAFGGYGLYYRSPLADIGIVARAGTLLGDRPILSTSLQRANGRRGSPQLSDRRLRRRNTSHVGC